MWSNGGDSNRRGGGSAARLEELIATAKTGSNSALGRALNACRPQLLQAARRGVGVLLRPQVGASDVVQDTFVNATKGFGVFKGQRASEFLNWLRKILFNRLAEIARRGRASRTGGMLESPAGVGAPLVQRLATEELSPSSIAGDREFAELIRAGLARLSQRDQEVLRLRYNEGLTFPQIGERISLSEDGARMLFGRAVKRLKRELPGECEC